MKITKIQILMLLMSLAGNSLSGDVVYANNSAEKVKQVEKQPFGEYLAGLHAAVNNDMRAAAAFHEKALILDPNNQMILRKSFTIFVADGRYDLALKVAHKLSDLKISDDLVQMFLFLEQVKSGHQDATLAQLDKIGDAGVYGLFKPLFQSWILQAQGKNQQAEDNIKKLLEKNSFKDFKQYHAGLFYEYIGNTQMAETMYSESLLIPGAASLRAVEAYGLLLRRLGRDKDARQLYKNYLEKAPDNIRLQRALSDLDNGVSPTSFISTQNDGIAEIFYTSANFLMQDKIRMPATIYLRFAQYLKKDFYVSDFLLAQIFEADLFYDGALEKYKIIPENNPLYFSAQLQIAMVLEKMTKLDEAIETIKKLSKKFPEKRELMASLGDIYRMNSRFEEAEKAYSQYIDGLDELNEKHWSIFYTRGIAYEQNKKWDLAEADLKKALELRPDQPQVLNYLAYSWVDKGVNIDKALKMLERAVELQPYDGYIIDSLGWAFYRTGDLKQAVQYLEKATFLQADDWAINDHLGDAYWAVGRKNEARFQWRHALSLKPDEKEVTKIKTKIRDGHN